MAPRSRAAQASVLNGFDLRQTPGAQPVRAVIARVMCAWSAKPWASAISARLDAPPTTSRQAARARVSRGLRTLQRALAAETVVDGGVL